MGKAESSKIYFDDTEKYLRSNPVIQLRKVILSDILGKIHGRQILDLGCGNGHITRDLLNDNRVTFADISQNMLDRARESIPENLLSQADFINSDLFKLSASGPYDIVVCMGVIAHIDDIDAFVKKLKELVTYNGIIVLQYTSAGHPISLFNELRYSLKGKKRYNYKITRTTHRIIRSVLAINDLVIKDEKRYLPVSPLFSVFSPKLKEKLVTQSYKNNYLSRFGSEIVITVVRR